MMYYLVVKQLENGNTLKKFDVWSLRFEVRSFADLTMFSMLICSIINLDGGDTC